jgi:hypothetical protein
MTFFERLEQRSRKVDSLLCVGLDPDFHKHKPQEIASFNRAKKRLPPFPPISRSSAM